MATLDYYTPLMIFSNLFSFGVGAVVVFYIFIRSDMAQIRGLRRFFRKKAEEEGNGKQSTEIGEPPPAIKE